MVVTHDDGITFFVPQRALQGTNVPLYVRWRGSTVAQLSLTIPESFELVEAHNGTIQGEGHTLDASGFGSTPYFGAVLRFGRSAEKRKELSLKVRLTDSAGGVVLLERVLLLYRPLLRITSTPQRIFLKATKEGVEVDSRVQVQNVGEGTAVIHFRSLEPDVRLRPSTALTDFQEKFKSDVAASVPAIASRHPAHRHLLERLVDFVGIPLDFGDQNRTKALDAFVSELIEACSNSEELGTDLEQMFIQAFTKNFRITTLMQQFVEYMRSIGDSRVILANPLDAVMFPAGTTTFDLELQNSDVDHSAFDPLVLTNVVVESTEPIEVPIHKLFQFAGSALK